MPIKSKKIAYITWGNSCQIISYYDFAPYIDTLIYAKDLAKVNLNEYRVVIFPDTFDMSYLSEHMRLALNNYILQGGFLIAFCVEKIEQWLHCIKGLE